MRNWTDFILRNEKAILGITIILTFLALTLLLGGCTRGSLPAEPAGPQGLATQLGTIGDQFILWGVIASGLGLICYFIPVLLPFRGISLIVGEAGTGCWIFGGISVWLSENFWFLFLACVLAGLAWIYYRRADIRRWFVSGKALISKIKESRK